ncbi:MAG: hypothetical protein LBP62_05140 [Clostridiales bacterium]|jgi:tetratricopeptide (TPR) repeat protein|nr:hypothetical protein [Clostridiales bacterium]
MSVVTLVCKQCGGSITLDDSREFGFCLHCGTKILIQEEIQNISYNTTYSTQQHITKIIHGREKTEAEEFLRNGDTLLALKDYAKAKEAYKQAVDANPGDWRVWFGFVRFYTDNLTDLYDKIHLEYLKKARSVAMPEQKAELEKEYADYAERAAAKTKEIVSQAEKWGKLI